MAASVSLETVIERLFNPLSSARIYPCLHTPDFDVMTLHRKYMGIPISASQYFEMPVMVYGKFNFLPQAPDTLVLDLHSYGRIPYYKTFDRYIKEILRSDYYETGLVKIHIDSNVYYATQGAIFDCNFKPIMLCSWVSCGVHEGQLVPVKPLIRLSPSFFLSPSNLIERFIAKKIPASVISLNNSGGIHTFGGYCKITLEIADSPFEIREAQNPSVLTKSRDLCNLAAEHLKETLL